MSNKKPGQTRRLRVSAPSPKEAAAAASAALLKCAKRGFSTEDEAEAEASKWNHYLRAYHCPQCGEWHLSTERR